MKKLIGLKDQHMHARFLCAAGVAASLFLLTSASHAAEECKSDADCKAGNICVFALTPHVCKPPQVPGSACVRDAGCVSKNCDIPAGKQVGICR